LSNRRTTP